MSLSDPATVLSIAIGLVFTAITGFAVYTAFGPPSTQLDDPYEDHED
ncbi:MAG: photosystem II reaction center protein PsbN [Acaryochloridaceae cyanobacterium RU_4_10]|jgi:PsbN protein|nr:photosystem II reaction center protein PsbN [Acaryochloridaceae cyanobacterium RU_4_10]